MEPEEVRVGVDFGIDLDEVRRVIDGADVLVVRLSITDRRLLVDARTNEEFGPMIKVVEPVNSAQERFRNVKILRPRFRVPQSIMTFHWPRHARALAESGIWDHVARRIVALGWPETSAQCDEAYRELLVSERRVEIEAIQGSERFQTLWPATVNADE